MNSQIPSPQSVLYDPQKVDHRRCFLINFLYFGIILSIAYLIVRYLFLWMLPFVLAFVVATFLQSPLKWLVKKTSGNKKFFSVVLVVLVILLIAGLVAIIAWQIVIGTVNFVKDQNNIHLVESTVLNVSDSIQELIVRFSNVLSQEALNSVQQAVSGISSNLIDFFSDLFTSVTASAANLATRLPMLLVSFIIWVIASIFLTIDYQKVLSFIMRQIPSKHTELVCTIRDLCTNTLFKLLRAYFLLMCITFVELSISFTILNVKYSLLIAVLVAIVDILPVLGTGTILIPWAIISLIMGNVHMFIGLGLTYIFITILRNILEPRLVSQQIGLNPLVTLFFMFLGLKAIGILGMFLFPVIVMVLIQLQDSGNIRLWK